MYCATWGVPYANFITGSGDGLDVELMKNFASYLEIKYQFVESDWGRIFGDLTDQHARRGKDGAEWLEQSPIIGDVRKWNDCAALETTGCKLF